MPRLDKTGPRGEGPKTGRGLGNCDSGTPDPDDVAPLTPGTPVGFGRGRGAGRGAGRRPGRGRGRGRWFSLLDLPKK